MKRRILLWLRSLVLLGVGIFYASGFWWLGKQPWVLYVVYGIAAAILSSIAVLAASFERKELLPWVFKPAPTLKSSLPSPFPSSFLNNSLAPTLSPSSSPSTSPSLPSVTIDHPVVGFRQWKLGTELRLHPLSVDFEPWQAITRAKCAEGKKHSAPDQRCTCGLYAYFTPPTAHWPSSFKVMGAVLGSGRILRHPQEGFRAETMRILALARPTLLVEPMLESCPKLPTVWLGGGYPSHIPDGAPAIRSPDLNYMSFGHTWETEGRSLELPSRTHRFNVKIKCKACGCGPEREYATIEHSLEAQHLGDIAAGLGVPVIPAEKIAAYAAEFGILPMEVKALVA